MMKESRELTRRVRDVDEMALAAETTAPPPVYKGVDGYSEQEVHLRDYWRAVRKRLWLVIGIMLLITTLSAIYMARKPDIYEAQARVQVDLENNNPALGAVRSGSVIINNRYSDPAYFNTQLQILISPGLLRRVVKTLDLEHNQDFLRPQLAQNRSTWQSLARMLGVRDKNLNAENKRVQEDVPLAGPVAPATARDDLTEAKKLAPYVGAIRGGLRVDPVKETRLAFKDTRLIDIRFQHPDPQIAAKVINALADAYVLTNLEKKNETSNFAGDYLQKRIAELQGQIRAGEEQLINYAKNHQILSLDASQNTVVERLAGLNRQLLEAENDRKLAESAYKASLAPGAAEAQADMQQIRGIEATLITLRQKRAQLLVDNTEEWPEVQEVTEQIVTLEKQLQEARKNATSIVKTNLETRYRQALAREESLRAAFNQQRGETLTQNEAAINYRIIQQEIETNKSLLDGLLQRNKENDVMMAGTPNNIHIIDYALVPESPIGPQRTRAVILALAFSLAFGVGFVLFLDYLDDTVRSTDDVEKMLHLPALGVIPAVGAGISGRRLFPKKNALQLRNGNGSDY
ncbi:MAG TPA: GumC family protein, partial [Pyrinomonadaceae bacterium]|nr:GumC family protein [Pyrinomonadaceae bacterium]